MLLSACGTHHQPVRTPAAEPGSKQFQAYCAACHQYDGQGMGDAPPLAGSPWVTGSENRLIRIVLHGLRRDREMPGFGQILSDEDVAALLSFVRRRYGAPSAPITPATVTRVRAATPARTEYWRVEELLVIP